VTGSGFAFNISSRIGSISGGVLAPYVIGLYGMANAWPIPAGISITLRILAIISLAFIKEAGDIELAQ